MNKKLKAVILSGLVLPGLGQLFLGRKVKGGVMLLLDNFFILAALFAVLRSVGKILAAGEAQTRDVAKLTEMVRNDAPFMRWLLAGFLVMWVYGVVDVLIDKGEQ